MVDSDLYPTLTYRDPLLFPLYLRTNDNMSIWIQSQLDWLLNSYINKLDNEIVDDIPDFVDQKQLISHIINTCRIFGWCAVQFYKTMYKVFTPLEWTDWVKEKNELTGKLDRVGITVKWSDDLGNNYTDKLYFDNRVNENNQIIGKCYLFIWERGNGQPIPNAPATSAFAIADLNTAVLGASIQCRQIQASLTFSATNPFFYHFVYGDSITAAQRQALLNQMSYVNTTCGIGAKEGILKEIKVIENSSTQNSILALNEMISFFASITRLPLSFYLGEKQTGGLGDTGETEDEIKIAMKKEFILQHFIEGLKEIFKDQFGKTLSDISKFYTNKLKKAQQEKADANNKIYNNNSTEKKEDEE